jgi:hypothetical protein
MVSTCASSAAFPVGALLLLGLLFGVVGEGFADEVLGFGVRDGSDRLTLVVGLGGRAGGALGVTLVLRAAPAGAAEDGDRDGVVGGAATTPAGGVAEPWSSARAITSPAPLPSETVATVTRATVRNGRRLRGCRRGLVIGAPWTGRNVVGMSYSTTSSAGRGS